MADNRHFKKNQKSPYLSNSLTHCHELLQSDAYWPFGVDCTDSF